MHILLTNDDGVYAPGLAAMEVELGKMGQVTVAAPATEQSGVSHTITFLTPLTCKEVYDDQRRRRGWAVDGSPADCVKLAISELVRPRPDLVVSGINGGLNAGINVLYSGTVAAAIEAAFFGITSFAVSLEFDEKADFRTAARIAREVIEQTLEQKQDQAQLYNLNLPTAATRELSEVRVVPMGMDVTEGQYIKRQDPKGRDYYWATMAPLHEPADTDTDLTALRNGFVTLTPLNFNMTCPDQLQQMSQWSFGRTSR